jgi:hypothetical protein
MFSGLQTVLLAVRCVQKEEGNVRGPWPNRSRLYFLPLECKVSEIGDHKALSAAEDLFRLCTQRLPNAA